MSELLQEHLSEHPIEPGPKLIARRYERLARNVHEQDKDEQVKLFLDALAQAYDPHSEYLSKADLKNFSINMGLSLVGIGAMLRTEDGYAKIESLVPGGPAQTDGRLKVGDRITAVAQGNGEFADVRDMRLDKVVEQIRGKKGTKVRLLVIPSDSPDPSKRKTIDLVRDEIKLKDQEARADIIIKKNENGEPVKLGWITLPSFYADMDRHQKSTTKDVLALLKRLKKENISGLIVDLRRNGGGSLEEAIALTGLFLKSGPIVQTKGSNGNIVVSSDPDPGIAYSGPMMVLTSRQSASASEIFAAALQDYGRALIVGDKNTFGKGTVQTILEIGRFTSLLGQPVAGRWRAEIDDPEILSRSRRLNPASRRRVGYRPANLERSAGIRRGRAEELPAATTKCRRRDTRKWSEGRGLFVDELKRRSEARVQANPEFRYVMEDMERLRKRLDENRISLNEDVRKAELNEDKLRKETRAKERLARHDEEMQMIRLTLDNVDKPNLQPISSPENSRPTKRARSPEAADDSDSDTTPGSDDGSKEPAIDPERDEALNILKDLVDLNRAPTTASTTASPQPPPN